MAQMKLGPQMSDDALLRLLGARVAGLRLAANLTQGQLAEQAGLGLRTVQRLELGATATQLSGFLRVCRVLGVLERLDTLVPEATPGPMAQLQAQGRKRQRARGRRETSSTPAKWQWGESP